MSDDYDVPEDWSEESKALFSRVYRHSSENQELFSHPKMEPLPPEQWNTICWNLAWMATDCAAGCGGFIHLSDDGTVLAAEVTKERMQ